MSALETRAYLVSSGNHYLCPLPLTGKTAHEITDWIDTGIAEEQEGDPVSVFRENYKGEVILAAKGYEFDRPQSFEKDGKEIEWNERVLVVHSPAHAKQQTAGLEARLETARKKIEALTPPRGKGRRQISDEAELLAAITKILENQRVKGLLNIQYEKEVEQKTKYVGRGRGSSNRKKVIVETIRYQITSIEKDSEPLQSKVPGSAGKHL